jgi:hypothetical protein
MCANVRRQRASSALGGALNGFVLNQKRAAGSSWAT